MSDEMQVQVQRPSATPYVLGGAVVGAGAGLVTNNLVRKTSYEDIIKEVNDKDAFTRNTADGAANATSWKDVQAQAEEVKRAEQALEEAKKPVLAADDKLAKELQQVTEEYDAKIAKMMEERTRTVGGGDEKVKSFTEVWHGYDKDKAKGLSKYNRLKAAYDREVKNIDDVLDSKDGLRTIQTARETELGDYIGKELKTYNKSKLDKIEDAFSQKYNGKKATAQFQRAIDTAEKAFPKFNPKSPDLKRIKPEEWLNIGYVLEKGEKPKGGRYATYRVPLDPNYPNKLSTIEYKKSDLVDYIVDTLNPSIEEKQLAYADELFDNAREAVIANYNKAHYTDKFITELHVDDIKNMGIKDGVEFKDILADSQSTKFVKKDAAGKITLQGYAYDDWAIRKAKRDGKPMPTDLNGKYGTTDIDEALEILSKRNKHLKLHNDELKKLEKEVANKGKKSSLISDLKAQIADYRANHEGLNKARANFESEFEGVIKGGGSRTTSVAGMTREEAIKKLDNEELGKRLARLKADYANKAKTSGAVDENAVKQATSKLDDAKAALKSKADDLASKMKGGTKQQKLIAAGIGLAAGIGAALMIKPKNKVQA